MADETAEKYVPTVERARAQRLGLPVEDPVEQHRLAAIVVHATILRREQWDEECSMRPGDVASLSAVPPAAPAEMRQADHRVLVEVLRTLPCPELDRECRACGGAGHSSIVLIQHHYDRIARMHEVYLPSHVGCAPGMLAFETALESSIAREPPECLRCLDLRPQQLQTAYRGGGKVQDPEFFGHSFGDGIERAGNAVMSFARRGKILRGDVRAYAWPFLWLRYSPSAERSEVALFVGHDGLLHQFVGSVRD